MRAPASPLALLLLLALATPLAAQEDSRSTRHGVYSEAQAQRGRTLYNRVCVDCHELVDFRGRAFLNEWVGSSLWELYEYMFDSMPEDAPGTRSPNEYAAVIAFILRENGFPMGDADLAVDEAGLGAIKFEAPEPGGGGPRR